ncbi:hypothetical protein EMN47_08880 [Prolixibacteraceae bacterium JC049]|nr:hypothetical protein [Prolixibacteraceae bacterium JC049]
MTMETKTAILLSEAFENEMQVDGEIGEVILESNSSTGYYWQYVTDNSGVYQLIEEIDLRSEPTVGLSGTPIKKIWKFKGIRKGIGNILFEYYAPGLKQPMKSLVIRLKVVE